ncbi:hypothetical protein DFH06DRAFT_1301024 [Mycena polygramma]|nr:hypothetical protein DFH06DRAFT_1301024 [Mycena polygramma]
MVALNPRFLVLLGLCVVASSNAMRVQQPAPAPAPVDVNVGPRSAPTPAVAVDPHVSLSHSPRSVPTLPVALPAPVPAPPHAGRDIPGPPKPPTAPKAPVDAPAPQARRAQAPRSHAPVPTPALPVPRANTAPGTPNPPTSPKTPELPKALGVLPPLPTNAPKSRALAIDHAPVSQNVSQKMVKRAGSAPGVPAGLPAGLPALPGLPHTPPPPSPPAPPHKRANPDPQPLEHPAIDRSYARGLFDGLITPPSGSGDAVHMYSDGSKQDMVIGGGMVPRKHGGGGGGAPDPAPADPAAADPPAQAQPADPAAQQQAQPQVNVVARRAAHVNDAVVNEPTSPGNQALHVNNQRRKHGAPDPVAADPAAAQQPGVQVVARATRTDDEVVSPAGSTIYHGHQTTEKRGH